MAAVATLAELSLIKHDRFEDGAPAVTVHRLVQAIASVRSERAAAAQIAFGYLIACLATIYPGMPATTWPHGLFARSSPRILLRVAIPK